MLNPRGPIGKAELELLFTAAGLMLIVIIPVFVLTFWFARRYRASNPKARYAPEWSSSTTLEVVIWLVPALIVAAVGYLVWQYSHRLDPYRPLSASVAPLDIQVVAEDWKWLFIYPKQDVAAVNEMVFPAHQPIRLLITSDTVMNSFYIPGLAGQIFAMAGMRTQLNLSADAPGKFRGRNTQYAGGCFPDQHFGVSATTEAGFDAWIAAAKRSPRVLDKSAYAALKKPSCRIPISYYSHVAPGLFAHIIESYAGPSAAHGSQ